MVEIILRCTFLFVENTGGGGGGATYLFLRWICVSDDPKL